MIYPKSPLPEESTDSMRIFCDDFSSFFSSADLAWILHTFSGLVPGSWIKKQAQTQVLDITSQLNAVKSYNVATSYFVICF
jgi:hypothetical protein